MFYKKNAGCGSGLTRQMQAIWIALFLMAFTPNFFLFFHEEITIKNGLYLLLSASFCLFPALFLRSKMYFGIYFLFVLSAPVEIGHIIINQTSLTSGFLLTLSDTNASEIWNYLSSLKVMIAATVFFWGLYIYLWIKIPNNYLLTGKKRKMGYCFYLLLFAGISALAIVSFIRQSEEENPYRIFRSITYSFKIKLENTYPYSLGIKTYDAVSEKRELAARYKKIENFTFNAVKKKDDECELYIFVMGESARYANFGVNGYSRNTTPFLDSLKNEGKLLTFSNVYASANLTINVHPILLTRATVPDRNRSNNEKSIINLCKSAGFKTYLLSNQGENETFLRQIALEADYRYINNNDFKFDGKYDGLLLTQIDSILNEKEKKKCLFLFTIGSHYKYNFRYPVEFERFKPTIAKSYFNYEIMEQNKDLFINAYDNSVLYTDYFLHEIIKKAENKNCNSALFYISDHGENIFDASGVNLGHGSVIPTKQELHIPMLIWLSDNYLQKNDSIFINLKNNSDKKINSANVFPTFANIAGIEYDLYEKEKDISAKTFVPDSVHWVLNPDLEAIRVNIDK